MSGPVSVDPNRQTTGHQRLPYSTSEADAITYVPDVQLPRPGGCCDLLPPSRALMNSWRSIPMSLCRHVCTSHQRCITLLFFHGWLPMPSAENATPNSRAIALRISHFTTLFSGCSGRQPACGVRSCLHGLAQQNLEGL